MTPPMELRWQCPEDQVTVVGTTEENAEAGVRSHFAQRDHEYLSLSGFTVSGPVIQGWVPVPTTRPLSSARHVHGRCPHCRASRVAADVPGRPWDPSCPRCGTALDDVTSAEPHPAIESVEAG